MLTDPALDGLRLACERTILAWTRTSLALIGFGFTIDKFFEAVSGRAKAVHTAAPRIEGILMICFGLASLAISHRLRGRSRPGWPG